MFFFFNDTATTEIYTLSLHDALPIWSRLLRFPQSRESRPAASSACAWAERASWPVCVSELSTVWSREPIPSICWASSANRFSTPAKRWSISTSCLLTSSLTQLLVAQPVVRSTAAGRRIAHVQCCRIATSSASGRITMQRLRQLGAARIVGGNPNRARHRGPDGVTLPDAASQPADARSVQAGAQRVEGFPQLDVGGRQAHGSLGLAERIRPAPLP